MWDESNKIRQSKDLKEHTDEQKIEIFKKELFSRNVIAVDKENEDSLKKERIYNFKRFSGYHSNTNLDCI